MTNEKRYYLKDSALTTVDDDFFRHQDVANNIIKILDNTKPPYNIAVIGKWGLGKSSLINMVSNYIEANPRNYLKVEINAWKYEKETLAKVFLRQVKEGIDPKERKKTEQEQVKEDVFEIVRMQIEQSKNDARKRLAAMWQKYWKEVLALGIWLIAISIVFYFYKMAYYSVNPLREGVNRCLDFLVSYCQSIGKLLLFPVALRFIYGILDGLNRKNDNQLEIKLPSIGVEDYEIYLEREIKKKVGDREDYKIVIILDDLDRLSIPKMVEALDAIKMFINFKNCIFIVPFDDAILKNAIEKNRLNPSDDLNIQSELLLDKLFQYKVYLPQLLIHDIKQYTVDLCKQQIPDFVKDYMNNDWKLFENVLRHILIHNEIETPRQVKKIVNAFVSNMMIARGRQEAGNAEPGFATKKDNINMIAKISVLQSDFNEFYDLLFVDGQAIELTLKAYWGNVEPIELPVELKKYFGITIKNNQFAKKALPLINFLISTNRYTTESIYPFLYMAMDDISIKTGSKRQQEFRKVLLSRNFVAAREQIKEMPELVDVINYILNDENDTADIASTLVSAITVFDLVEDKEDVIKAVAKVCDEIVKDKSEEIENDIHYNNMVSMYIFAEENEKQELEKLMIYCLESQNYNAVMEKMHSFISKHKQFNEKINIALQKYVRSVIDERRVDVQEFREIREQYNLEVNEYWSQEYLKYLIDIIADEGVLTDEIILELESVYKYMLDDWESDKLFAELEKLYGITKLSNMFYRLLDLNSKTEVSIETKSKLVKEQIENEDEDSEKINPLVLNILYKVDADDVAIFDGYFKRFYKEPLFSKLVINYCEMNSISNINAAIREFISYAFANPCIESEKQLESIVDLLNDSQSTFVKANIDSHLSYSSSKADYPNISNIIGIYARREERFDVVMPIFVTWTRYIATNNANNAYLDFFLECVNCVISYYTDASRTELFSALVKRDGRMALSNVAISLICNMGEYMSDSDYEKIAPVISTRTSEETCVDAFYFMDKYWHVILTAKDYTAYLKVALLAMKKERYINSILKILGKRFNGVSSETLKEILICILESEKVDLKENATIIAKFVDALDSKVIAEILVGMLVEYGIDSKIITIFDECKKNTLKTIVNYIASVSGEYSLEGLLELIDVIQKLKVKDMNMELCNLYRASATRLATEDEYAKLASLLCKMNKEYYIGVSKNYVEVYSSLVSKTSSKELKKNLADATKKVRIFKNVKNVLDEKLQKEWVNY